MKKTLLLLLPTALSLLSSCVGYHPGADKPSALAGITKLAVPTFENKTLVPHLEVEMTNALIKKLQAQGSFKIVSREEADAVLLGEITDIERSQFRSVRDNTLRTSEILSRLRVNYSVVNRDGAKIFYGKKNASSHQVLDTNFHLTESQILADAAEQLSSDMASELTEGW